MKYRKIYREKTGDWMKLRIKSMIWNIRKQKTTMQSNKKRKESKNEDSISSIWDNFKRSNIFLIGVTEGEEKARNWKSI